MHAYAIKIEYAGTGTYTAFFGLKTESIQKSVTLGMISAHFQQTKSKK